MSNDLPLHQLYTQEAHFEQVIDTEILDFWQTKEDGKFKTRDKKKLYWCRFTSPTHDKSLLIINGRVESCLKYRELFFELFKQGYNIYSYDHRGQGLSDRLVEDPQIGYVEWFNDYIHDLESVIEFFDLSKTANLSLLAHSMGGAVALRYLQTHHDVSVQSLVLSSPMLGFHLPWKIRPIAIPYSQIMASLSFSPNYVKGYGQYTDKPFKNNPLSQSESRYHWFRQLYQSHPELQVGGPSYRWVWQSLIAVKQCYQLTRQITLPVLILQAGDDTIVNNQAQLRFFHKLTKTNAQVTLDVIENARHELLFEKEHYRSQALSKALQFFDRHRSHR